MASEFFDWELDELDNTDSDFLLCPRCSCEIFANPHDNTVVCDECNKIYTWDCRLVEFNDE